LTFEPLHILRCQTHDPAETRTQTFPTQAGPEQHRRVICLTCIASSGNEAAKTVKLTPHHQIPKDPSGAIYRRLIHRSPINQTAHISLQIPEMSKSTTTPDTNETDPPIFLAQPAPTCQCDPRQALRQPPSPSFHPIPTAPSAPPVRGYLRIRAEQRKRKFGARCTFFDGFMNSS
jgi:hypothetical protein